MGMAFEIVGRIGAKDFYTKEGKTFHTVRIEFEGGNEQFRYENPDELKKWPDEGQPCKVRGKLVKNGDFFRFEPKTIETPSMLEVLLSNGVSMEQLQAEMAKRTKAA